MNENGISLVETLLSLVIIMILCGTVLPISNVMKNTLQNKKYEVHATEAAYEGLKINKRNGDSSGVHMIDGAQYKWAFDGVSICVRFQNVHEQREKCIRNTGDNV